MKKRTYLDSSVLIQAFRGEGNAAQLAMGILDDPDRQIIVSDFLKLEVLPKPSYYRRNDELDFMKSVIENAENVTISGELTSRAVDIACEHDLTAIDALHVSSALTAEVDEFVTMEKTTKPMFTVATLNIVSLSSLSE